MPNRQTRRNTEFRQLNPVPPQGSSGGEKPAIPAIRLEGDDLFTWSRISLMVENAIAQANQFSAEKAKEYQAPEGFVLNGMGYFVPRESLIAQAQQEMSDQKQQDESDREA